MDGSYKKSATGEPGLVINSSSPAARRSSRSSESPAHSRIAHTLTACTRCRQRKSRCDTGIPRCEPCQRSNAQCVFYDPARNVTIPRTYILQLRDRIRRLSEELHQVENEIDRSPNAEIMVREAGLIKFKETDESRFLGPSSGIAMTRFVMKMAKQNTDTKSIKEVVNDTTAQEIKSAFLVESQKPTSKIYPLVSSVAEPNLPPRDLTNKLLDIFMAKSQYMLPTLHEPTFRREVDTVLNGSQDPCLNFQVRLVIAISMQKIDTAYAGLADSYYLAALEFLDASIKRKNVATLQCVALMAMYSMLTPTRTAAYWVVGVAARLCQELGMTDESTITKSPDGRQLNYLEIDMRRRLFWIIVSMEYGLSHSLGRPSAFGVSHDHINVKFFEMVDDRYITPEGVIPGSPPIMKKCIAIHFFKMRLLQAEIRRTLYLKKRPTPADDQDPWFTEMLAKLDHWVESCPKNDEGCGLSEVWFQGRRNTMIVFMFRPSPQIPQPSLKAAQRCYDACVFNAKMHRHQVDTGSVDLTWIFTQSVFMALNTILWSLSYPAIRQEHPIEEVKQHISLAMEVLAISAHRWPGVESAAQLYKSLIVGCLRAYNTDESFVIQSPSANTSVGPSPAASHDVTSPPPSMPSPTSAAATAVAGSHLDHSVRESLQRNSQPVQAAAPAQAPYGTSPTFAVPNGSYSHDTNSAAANNSSAAPAQVGGNGYSSFQGPPQVQAIPQIPYQFPATTAQVPVSPPGLVPSANGGPTQTQSNLSTNGSSNGNNHTYNHTFDPNSLYNEFPSVVPGLQHWDPNYATASTSASHLTFPASAIDPMNYMGFFGHQYSQFFNQSSTTHGWKNRSLTQKEHMELMADLAQNVPEMPPPMNEVTASYDHLTP